MPTQDLPTDAGYDLGNLHRVNEVHSQAHRDSRRVFPRLGKAEQDEGTVSFKFFDMRA